MTNLTGFDDNSMSCISRNHKHSLLVITDDSRDDRVSKLFESDASFDSFDVRVCALSIFLKDRGFCLEKNTHGLSIFERHDSDHDEDEVIVLSRVVGVSDVTLDVLNGSSAWLHRGQVLWALELALDDYKKKLSKSGLYSTVGCVLPLPTQYALIKKFLITVNLPEFFCLAFFEVPPGEMQKRNLIVKSPFDFYHWKPGMYDGGADKVVLVRPKGSPVVTYVMGERCWNMALGSATLPDNEILNDMTGMARRIHQIFGGFILEILWFVDDDGITYACSSHLCRSLSSFDLLNGFESELMRLCDEFVVSGSELS